MSNGNHKPVQEVITDLKEELKEFLNTRFAMLRAEMTEKANNIRMVAPVLLIGVGLLLTAWVTFTGLVIVLVAHLVPGPWAYVISFAIVTFAYGAIGAASAMYAWGKLKHTGVKPERTIRVLEQDRVWLQAEAKTQV